MKYTDDTLDLRLSYVSSFRAAAIQDVVVQELLEPFLYLDVLHRYEERTREEMIADIGRLTQGHILERIEAVPFTEDIHERNTVAHAAFVFLSGLASDARAAFVDRYLRYVVEGVGYDV